MLKVQNADQQGREKRKDIGKKRGVTKCGNRIGEAQRSHQRSLWNNAPAGESPGGKALQRRPSIGEV